MDSGLFMREFLELQNFFAEFLEMMHIPPCPPIHTPALALLSTPSIYLIVNKFLSLSLSLSSLDASLSVGLRFQCHMLLERRHQGKGTGVCEEELPKNRISRQEQMVRHRQYVCSRWWWCGGGENWGTGGVEEGKAGGCRREAPLTEPSQ